MDVSDIDFGQLGQLGVVVSLLVWFMKSHLTAQKSANEQLVKAMTDLVAAVHGLADAHSEEIRELHARHDKLVQELVAMAQKKAA